MTIDEPPGPTIIYVSVLDEGVDVWTAVAARRVSAHVFEILASPVPPDEKWEFSPGQIVRCNLRQLSGGPPVLVAEKIEEGT